MPNKKIPPLRQKRRIGLIALMPMVTAMAVASPIVHATDMKAASPLAISSASYNPITRSLIVNATIEGNVSGTLTLLHGSGGILGQAPAGKTQTFSIPLAQLGQIPCSVEARISNYSVSKSVSGAPSECKKIPTCNITTPISGTHLTANNQSTRNAQR
ncbi:MAG: hypothetical protein PHN45_08840 [Methylococcales bacterium]|nr:hypothetical protein [Methylococcales bacterium]MDD5754843.1 hypothetical protein [Methylococcales bacterium]